MENSTSPPDSRFIQTMFNDLAPRYDLFNQLTSLGMAGRWREATLDPLRKGMRVLDLGCGTGDLSIEAIRKMGGEGEVVGLDFSEQMLEVARKRCGDAPGLRFEPRPAEDIPFEDKPYDLVVSGFVLRNIYQNIDTILKGVHQSLKPGGQISFLDITESEKPWVSAVWKFYMGTATALYGKLLFGKNYPTAYLTESAARFSKPTEFVKKLERAGFKNVRVRRFMFGVIVLYQAVK